MPTNLVCAAASSINFNKIDRNDDGSLVMNATVARSGDYDYFGYELPSSEDQGYKWDQPLVGRMSKAVIQSIANQLEGTPLTEGHVFIDAGDRAEHAIGTMLTKGDVDEEGFVHSRASIHSPKTIMKLTSGEGDEELSIGFRSDIVWRNNPPAKGPHFDITGPELNHVAVIPLGRAGPKARLANHKSKLKPQPKDTPMKKIMINGVEHEVSEVVALEFARLNSSATEMVNSASALTTERDALQGQLTVSEANVVTLQNSAVSEQQITEAATALTLAHAGFTTEAEAMGHTEELVFGAYDTRETKIAILNAKGSKIANDATDAYVGGAWEYALSHAQSATTGASVLDGIQHAQPQSAEEMTHAAANAEHGHYFGGKQAKGA